MADSRRSHHELAEEVALKARDLPHSSMESGQHRGTAGSKAGCSATVVSGHRMQRVCRFNPGADV
jgi:hypothetical protein